MADLTLGRTFWSMILRFALVPPAASALGLLFLLLFKWDGDETTIQLSYLQNAAIMLWSIVVSTWFGWGLAFWRFDRHEIPVRSFVAYPMLTGPAFVLVFWVLASTGAKVGISEYVAVTIFGVVVGPLLAVLTATACRYLLQTTALRKPRD